MEQFPLPDPARKESREAIALARTIHRRPSGAKADQMARELDQRVWQLFGLEPPQGLS